MKIEAVKNDRYNNRVYHTNVRSKAINKAINQGYSPAIQLPNYELMSSKFPLNAISFNGDFLTTQETNNNYVEQLKKAEEELEALKNERGDSSAVEKAIEENHFYDDFKQFDNYYWKQASKEADLVEASWEKEHVWCYKMFHSGELSRLRHEKFQFYYYNKLERANEIESRYDTNKSLIENSRANEETKAKRKKELEASIEQLKRLIDYSGLRKSIDEALMGHGGLNDRIAGYSEVKNKIRKFIESLSASKNNEDAYVSPCVILYGDTGTGKTTFLHSIENMTSDDVSIIRFDNDEKVPFMNRFRDACANARERYRETGKRTILLMDDAEKYFCMPEGEAKQFYRKELDESDMEKLETINRNGTNAHVKDFKAILDVLSQVPGDDEDDSYKSAMSIFITTNHPHLIDRQLIKRPEKMDAYHVGPAQGEDLKKVVEFYFKDKAKIVQDLKIFKDRPDMEAAIDSLTNLDIDAKNSIKKYFRAEKADQLNIDPSSVDYEVLTEDIQPSLEEGAYSNVMIKRISFNAFEKYLQNPEEPFAVYFYDELLNTKRDVEPQRYKRYLETSEFVNLYKQTQQIRNIEDRYEFARLLDKRNKKLISKQDAVDLENFLQAMSIRLKALEEKQEAGTLSEQECVELEQIKEQDELNKDAQKVKEYLKAHKK